MAKTPTPHIGAAAGEIADKVIMAGDPLRAKVMAERFLENPVQYNNVRGMLGFTGTYKGKRVGWQEDINRLVAAKAKHTKRLRAVEEYIASQQGNLFFDPATDEQLLKAQAKLKLAEQDIAAAHERMKTKFNNMIQNQ